MGPSNNESGRVILCAALMLLAMSAHSVANAETAIFHFDPVPLGAADSVYVDLGGPVAGVQSVRVAVAGMMTLEQWTCMRDGDEIWHGIAGAWVAVSMVHSEARALCGLDILQDGAFSFDELLVPDIGGTYEGILSDGTATLVFASVVGDEYFINECAFQYDGSFGLIRAASIQYETSPTITIDYEPAVGLTSTTWGTIKAVYR